MDQKDVIAALQKEFPDSALKKRVGGGGKTFTYIEGHAAIHRMLDVAPNHNVEYITHWLYEDTDPKGKTRITLNMLVSLTIPNLGTRVGHGVAVLGGGEDLAKGALTDAYKNALKYFGLGLSLYGEDYEAPPPPPSQKKVLSDLLKQHGHTTQAAMMEATRKKFGKDKLTDDEIASWVEELSTKSPVPF